MRVLLQPQLIALLCCLLEIPNSTVSWMYGQVGRSDERTEQQRDNENKKPSLKALFMAAGKTGDGTPLDIRTYESLEGVKLTTAHAHFTTAEGSNAELHRQVRQATKIIQQGAREACGLVIGERALVLLEPMKTTPPRAAVLLTDGRDYYEIVSPSLELVLEVEEGYYRFGARRNRSD